MKRSIFPGWWQVAACLVLQAVTAATISSAFSVVAVPLGEAFDASRMMVMLAMTFVAMGTGVLSPVLGTLMDRYSLRNLMLFGAFTLVSGFVAVSFATSMIQVLLIYGLLLAPANVLLGPLAASVLVSRWFSRKRGAALGIAAVGISIGGFIFPPVIQLLIEAFEWRAAFRWIAAIAFCCTVPAILLLVINHPADRRLFPDGADEPPEGSVAQAAAPRMTTPEVLRDPTFWLVAIVVGVIFFGAKGLLTNMVPLAMDAGTLPTLAALLISFYAASSLVGKLVFAAIADRIDPRLLLCIGLVGFAIAMSFFWQGEKGYWVMAAGGVLLGVANGGVLPLKSYLLARSFGPENLGRVAGMITLATLPLNLAAPPLFGLVYDLTGSYDPVLVAFAFLSLAAILAVPRIRTRRREMPGDDVPAPAAASGDTTAG